MLYVNIVYNIEDDKFEFDTNLKNERVPDVLCDFLRTQMGKGEDKSPANEHKVYNIRVALDPKDDTFHVKDDCGNKGLRDGILMEAMRRLFPKVPTDLSDCEV